MDLGTYIGPLRYAQNLKHIMNVSGLTESQLSDKINVPVMDIKRALWLLTLTKVEQKVTLVDKFIDLIGEKVSQDDKWLGQLKATLKEIVNVNDN